MQVSLPPEPALSGSGSSTLPPGGSPPASGTPPSGLPPQSGTSVQIRQPNWRQRLWVKITRRSDSSREGEGSERRWFDNQKLIPLLLWLPFWGGHALIALFAWSLLAEPKTHTVLGTEFKFNWASFIWMVQLAHIFMSFKIITAKKMGVRMILGHAWHTLSAGLRLKPFGLCWIETESRLTMEDEFPGNPEKVIFAESDEPLKEGFVRAIPVTFSNSRPLGVEAAAELATWRIVLNASNDDTLDARVTGTLHVALRWRIIDYMTFIKVMGDSDNARINFRDIAVNWAKREFQKVRLSDALPNLGGFSDKLKHSLEIAVGNIPPNTIEHPRRRRTHDNEIYEKWGVEIETAVVDVHTSHSLNRAIQGVAEASAEVIARIKRAEALKIELTKAGEGEAAAIRARTAADLESRTQGMQGMASGLGVDSRIVLASETATNTAGKADNLIVVGKGGAGELLGLAAAVKATYTSKNNPPPTAPVVTPPPTPPVVAVPSSGTPPTPGKPGGNKKKHRNRGQKGGTI